MGCGSGTWIKVFKEFGVKEVLGIDFHNVKPIISEKEFFKHFVPTFGKLMIAR